MTIRSDEAAAMLADVDSVVAKVKQSRLYRTSALIMILWGAVNVARDVLIALAPTWFGPRWFLIDAIGIIGTLALLRWVVEPGARFPLRILAAFCLFYAFGWIWANFLGGFGPREQMAFWPTLFLFGYALAGLWFGTAFSAIGLGAHGAYSRWICLVRRSVSTVASGGLRRRIHSVRPLDAAGLSDGRVGRRHPSAYSLARHGGADRLRSERRGP